MRGAGARISSGAVSLALNKSFKWPNTISSLPSEEPFSMPAAAVASFQGFFSLVASFLKSLPWTSQKICCVSAVTFFRHTVSQESIHNIYTFSSPPSFYLSTFIHVLNPLISNCLLVSNLLLVRADISRLPFPSGSIDAAHAGAALHCWPSPATAVAEISRVLRPGGVFVATTFIIDLVPPAVPFLRLTRQYIAQFTSNTIYVSETELEDLCRACGLVDFTCVRNGFFVMISANKPGLSRTAADMQ